MEKVPPDIPIKEDVQLHEVSSCVQAVLAGEEQYKCDWDDCDKIFNTLLELDNHASAAHAAKDPPYMCQWKTCRRRGSPFEHFFSFVNHMRTHIAKTTHPCPVQGCNKRYRTFESLKNHITAHSAPKPYVCFIGGCFHSFATVSERTKHIFRAHSNLKRFLCPMLDCTRRYSDPSSLRKHLKSLHGESAYTVFRELKSSVRIWEKSFRIRNDVHGVAHIVGVNGETIDFDEIVKHIVDMTSVEVQQRQDFEELEENHEGSEENIDPDNSSRNTQCYSTPAFHPYILYPPMSSFWLYPKPDVAVDMKLVTPPSLHAMESMISPDNQSDSASVSGVSSRPSSSRSCSVMSPFIGPLTPFCHSFDQSVIENTRPRVTPVHQNSHQKSDPQTPRTGPRRMPHLRIEIPHQETNQTNEV